VKFRDGTAQLSVCKRLERTVLRPELLPVKTAQSTQFFVMYDVTQ